MTNKISIKNLLNKPAVEPKLDLNFNNANESKSATNIIEKAVTKIEKDEIEFSLNDFDFDFAKDILEPPAKTLQSVTSKNPKESLIEFLKTSQLDVNYEIEFNGSYELAKAFIHRMRVELSRFRAQIIALGKQLDHFHVLTKSIEVQSENRCLIILLKTHKRQRFDAPKALDVLDFLTIKEQ